MTNPEHKRLARVRSLDWEDKPLPDLGFTPFIPQAEALKMIVRTGGNCIARIGVGGGKTAVFTMAGTVLGIDSEDILGILPAQMRDRDYPIALEQQKALGWKVTPPGTVISFQQLAGKKWDTLKLRKWKLIIVDEAHTLCNRDNKGHKRIQAYRAKWKSDVAITVMSGTFFKDSIMDAAPLFKVILGNLSPLPIRWPSMCMLANVIDPYPQEHPTKDCKAYASRMYGIEGRTVTAEDVNNAIEANPFYYSYHKTSAEDVNINLVSLKTPIPGTLIKHMYNAEKKFIRPGGGLITGAPQKSRTIETLSLGFYLVWDWKDGEPNYKWLRARADWNSLVTRIANKRGKISETAVKGLITKGKIYLTKDDKYIVDMWSELSHIKEPPTKAVWITEEVVKRLVDYAFSIDDPTLVWYHNIALADKLGELGMPVLYSGDVVPATLPNKEPETLALSIGGFGTGKRLQMYRSNIFLQQFASSTLGQQALGRTHREGQTSDEVTFRFLQHTLVAAKRWTTFLLTSQFATEIEGEERKVLKGTGEIKDVWI